MTRSRMPVRLARALPVLALAAALAGCGGGPSLRYRVDFAHANSEGVPVTLELTGVPRDSLVLEGYRAAPLMRVRDVEVVRNGVVTGAAVTLRTLDDGSGGEAEFPVVRLDGPLPRTLTVRWRAALGNAEGNDHTGWTGRRAGWIDARFAFAGGRSLFLAPAPAGRMRDITVRFDLPAGWSAVVPWARDRDAWRPGIPGTPPVEDLLWSPLAFGRFGEHRVALPGGAVRFAIEAGIASADGDSALRAYTAIAQRLASAFGHAPGRDWLVAIVPPVAGGDELMHEGWATGLGGTLAPVTTARAHQVAASMTDATLAFRTKQKDAKQRWVARGVARLVPWIALEAAGLSRREDLERRLASDAARTLEDSDPADLEWDLERVPTSDRDTQLADDVLAPLALLRAGDVARAVSGGRDSLDTVLRAVYAGGEARDVWGSLPHGGDARWAALRARVRGVNGAATLAADPLFAAPAAALDPAPPRGVAVRRLVLALTGNSAGFLENCGCKVNQAGGVARRATMLRRLGGRGPLLVLDAGNALAKPEHYPMPDFLALEEEKAYVDAMNRMGYAAAAVGPDELGYGLGRFRAAIAGAAFPFLAANARDSAGALGAPLRVVRAGGVRVAIVGLAEPGRGPWANDVLERHLGRAVAFDDPVDALRRVLPDARRQADLVVAMGTLAPPTVRRIAAACPDVDVVVSTDAETGARSADDPAALASGDAQGFLGRTLVLYTTQSSFGLNGATLGLDASNRVTSAEMFASWLGDSVPDDRAVRDALTRFYDRIGRTQAAQASVPALFAGDPSRTGRWAGAAACRNCHAAEYVQWKETPHASAYKTLLDVHRHYQPRCIVCHVVGYGTPGGFTMGSADTRLASVQCELCHGAGAAHVATPRRDNIARAVPERVCLECHTPDHSDHFVDAEKRPRVTHQQLNVIDVNGK